MKTALKLILYFCFGLSTCKIFAHDQPVHRAITLNAAATAYDNSVAYTDFINLVSLDLSLSFVTNYMAIGSWDEDFADQDEGGKRSYNHFYDPITGLGLDEVPPDIRWLVGVNSFKWVSVSNCPGLNFSGLFGVGKNVNKFNKWSWQNARGYEWIGLTATNQSDRTAALTNMFRSVGQVMHLLEDTSQPQHVRNEQHVNWHTNGQDTIWSSPIENWGREHVNLLKYQAGMLDWRGDGFTKLEDFWNRHKYNGDAAALNADYLDGGTSTLGLAEWCNGNFLGDRHTYAELFSPSSIKYYPNPSLKNTSQPQINPNDLSGTVIDTVTLENHKQGDRVYIQKFGAGNPNGSGIPITHQSALTYFAVKHPPRTSLPSMEVGLTIRDDNVLKDYHNALIPKAVEYSAGLLDYFFRGTMDANVIGYDTNSMLYTNLIVNTSSQDFSGGAFSIYTNDASGNRSLIAQTNLSDVLPNGDLPSGQSVTMTFPGPIPTTNNLLLVYRGSIGTTDPVDAGFAIAAKMFHAEYQQTLEYGFNSGDGGLSLPFTLSTNLMSDDFPFPLVSGNYEVIINGGQFDDAGSIGGIATTIFGSPCGAEATFANLPIVIPADQVSIVGNHLEVVLSCTDNCPVQIGWLGVSITWRAWPAQ